MAKLGLIVVDPGHFHAALALQEMYDNVAEQVHVYAPVGPDLVDYLTRIARFNTRAEAPTAWQLEIHAGADFVDRMARERAGNAAIFAGRNNEKIAAIAQAVDAGINVLADKPMIVRRGDLPALEAVLEDAAAQGLVVLDMMGGRQEITRSLTRLLHADPEIFGEQVAGSASEPGVEMSSVHHLMKMVSGVPNPRPPWYFDIRQQGDALADIGTALERRIASLAETHRGLSLERHGGAWKIAIPDGLRIGHDAHFRELTRSFLAQVERPGSLPAETNANLLAKYFITTAADAAML